MVFKRKITRDDERLYPINLTQTDPVLKEKTRNRKKITKVLIIENITKPCNTKLGFMTSF